MAAARCSLGAGREHLHHGLSAPRGRLLGPNREFTKTPPQAARWSLVMHLGVADRKTDGLSEDRLSSSYPDVVNATPMIKLNLLQNALHTLHHAVEHLQWSEGGEQAEKGRVYDPDDGSVSWRNRDGHLCFQVPDFTRMPSNYDLKFSLLHLIQAAELLLKAYVERCDPAAIFTIPGSTRTVNLQKALEFATVRNPDLLTPTERVLLLEAKHFRNAIEHFKFQMSGDRLRTICVDFLVICVLLSQKLLSLNIADVFSWDCLNDRPDPVADYLGSILAQATETGRESARRAGELWASENPSVSYFVCWNCGARAVSRDRGLCMGCGSEHDTEIAELLEDWQAAELRLAELRKHLDQRGAHDDSGS